MAAQKQRAVVLLSGGMDSCVCASLAARDFDAAALHVNYGQRTEDREQRAFHAICDRLRIPDRLIVRDPSFRAIGGSALTDKNIAVPAAGAQIGQEVPVTYVPFRNAVLLSMAVSWAEALGAMAVYYGAVSADSSGYPDCRPSFVEAFNRVIAEGTKPGSGIEVKAPLVNMTKAEIVELAASMGLPLEHTWSCYSRNDLACGECDSCALRLRGFEQAHLKDPIPYAKPRAVRDAERREAIRRLHVLLKALTRAS